MITARASDLPIAASIPAVFGRGIVLLTRRLAALGVHTGREELQRRSDHPRTGARR
ncbi:hypothetical protein [Streptomyces sp. SM12]|uniref:hypothetical protein n=1 Tax=Streptomyces sp. SM12 TaxID=1071602 RepID=UPI0014773546|nr:hypothetical protein [Streptomyces sp. SM12]